MQLLRWLDLKFDLAGLLKRRAAERDSSIHRATPTMKFSLIFLFFLIAIAYACTPLTGGGEQKGGEDAGNQDAGKQDDKTPEGPANTQHNQTTNADTDCCKMYRATEHEPDFDNLALFSLSIYQKKSMT
uniref:Secreted protein n=1 Tax=Steinernema glaseri TaxID=37863 RepID=A0A1I8ADT8_9BILA